MLPQSSLLHGSSVTVRLGEGWGGMTLPCYLEAVTISPHTILDKVEGSSTIVSVLFGLSVCGLIMNILYRGMVFMWYCWSYERSVTTNKLWGGLPPRSCLNWSLLIEDNCHQCLAAVIQGLSPYSFSFCVWLPQRVWVTSGSTGMSVVPLPSDWEEQLRPTDIVRGGSLLRCDNW